MFDGEKFEIYGYVINNVPKYAMEAFVFNNEYLVARYINEEFWFWGTYPTNKEAVEASIEIGGIIFKYE